MENHPGKYVIRDTVNLHWHHSAVYTCIYSPSLGVSPLEMTC